MREWLEISLFFANGEPAAGQRFVAHTSGSARRIEGTLDESGHARFRVPSKSPVRVAFPDLQENNE